MCALDIALVLKPTFRFSWQTEKFLDSFTKHLRPNAAGQ